MPHFLYLVPLSLIFGVTGVAIFFWSVKSQQYEDLKGAAERILHNDDKPLPPTEISNPTDVANATAVGSTVAPRPPHT